MENKASNQKIKWVIDPAHSEISFKVKHLMITSVQGKFTDFTADISTEGDDLNHPSIQFTIKSASVTTNDDQRDGHLRSADFFDADTHPEIVFAGKSYKKLDMKGHYRLTGDLTIRGISREIALDVEFHGFMKDPWGNKKAGFSISGIINRKDWNLNWNAALESGGVLVSDEVRISCEVQLIRQA